jgi:formylglycine-generating enzyme required for sulfatase activity
MSLLAALVLLAAAGAPDGMVPVPGGSYQPFLQASRPAPDGIRRPVTLAPYLIDRHPVTNGAFLDFVRYHPEWRRSQVKPIFADSQYLAHWRSDLALGAEDDAARPVTHVSWFAAEAYCAAAGGDLPTIDQWEYALDDAGRDRDAVRARGLAWYARPASEPLGTVAGETENGYGIAGLVGAVWEWTLDFNGVPGGAEARDAGTRDSDLFCGGGSLGALDATDYFAYMRFAMRASLRASYTTASLGFRCVSEPAP